MEVDVDAKGQLAHEGVEAGAVLFGERTERIGDGAKIGIRFLLPGEQRGGGGESSRPAERRAAAF